MTMKSKNFFWGIVLLSVGVLSLMVSLNVVDFSWRIAWRLWPMLLIFIGIFVLPVKDWLKTVLVLVSLAVGVLLYQHEANSAHHWFSFQSAVLPGLTMFTA